MKVRDHLADLAKSWCAQRGMVLAKYASNDRKALLRDVMRLKSTGHLQQNPAEGCQLVSALRATSRVHGDIAEVGTSRGGSARLIGEYSSGKTIHVFDTFEGLPDPGPQDPRFAKGAYSCSLEKVQEYLKGLPVEFHKGIFPHSAANVRNLRFSFVHLDVDLYQSTLDCLKFFYPRLNLGGIIISHDYTTAEGVNQAFEEFFSDKPETPMELIGYQVMAVKFSNQNIEEQFSDSAA
jgi:O-methyltransferase